MNKDSVHTGKKDRQALILQAVRGENLGTQQEIVQALKKRGVEATQVSISRDIAELGLVKAGGRYQAASAQSQAVDPDFPLRAWVNAVLPAGPNLVVLKCDAGTAPRVGLALDQLTMPELVGTLAGDDTVFCAVASSEAGKRLLALIKEKI